MNWICNQPSDDWRPWSAEITWRTENPKLTLCFQYTILYWIPMFFLWLSCLAYIPILKKRHDFNYGCRGRFNIFKSVLVVFLFYSNVLSFCLTISEFISDKIVTRAMFLHPVLFAISMVLVIYINQLTFIKGVHSCEVLFLFWLIQTISSSLSLMSTYQRIETLDHPTFKLSTNAIELIIVSISFLLNCFSDATVLCYKKMHRSRKFSKESLPSSNESLQTCPEQYASFLSKLMFSWLNSLLYKGFKRPVTMYDLYSLQDGHTCAVIFKDFQKRWLREVSEIQKRILEKFSKTKERFARTYQSLRNDPASQSQDPTDFFSYFYQQDYFKEVASPSLIKTIFKILGLKYFLLAVIRILIDQLLFIQPTLLGLLITFIEERNDLMWHGLLIVLSMFAVSMMRTVVYQQYNHVSNVLGMKLRSGLITFIYRKSLRLSASSRRTSTLGEIVNLMSVDAQRLPTATFDFLALFSIPISMTVGFYLLWQELGMATVAGIMLILFILPINAIIGLKVKTLQKEQMELKDTRIKWMSEILGGIKVLKLYAWEKSFEDRIQTIRDEECRILRLSTYLNSINAVCCFCAPYLIALSSFAMFILSSNDNVLNTNKAFVSLSIVNLLNTPVSYLPGSITFIVQTYVSLKRINKFLIEEELCSENVIVSSVAEHAIEIVNGTFSWGRDDNPILNGIDITVSEGELIAVVGTVGSGKSSLINAILGEMHKVTGQVRRKGSIAYVPQQAWCQNASIQDNILFGKLKSAKEYKNVIRMCALDPDLKILPYGDLTEVGEKGINLSGGQKQRIGIARAVYQDAEIYLFDDPLSAVDAHVNMHIFEKVFGRNGILSNKTRIIVTHDISLLPKVDKIYLIKDRRIKESGTYENLLSRNGAFTEFVDLYIKEAKQRNNDMINDGSYIKKRGNSISESAQIEGTQKRSHSRRISSKVSHPEDVDINDQADQRLIRDEHVETGSVKFRVFLSYLRSATFRLILLITVSYLIFISSSISANLYLSSWTENMNVNLSHDVSNRNTFLLVYGGLGIVQTTIILLENLALAQASYRASKSLHVHLLRTLLRVSNSFFEITPVGRILNRIGKDIDTVDVNIPSSISAWMFTASGVLGTIVVICIATPYFLIALVPLSLLYYFIQKFYICTNRQLKRIDLMTRSPIYSHFHETITGGSSIRAFGKSESFIAVCDSMIDINQVAWYPNIVSFRWLQLNLEFVGNLVILFSGLFAVFMRQSIEAGLVGLSISYALQITLSLNNMVRNTCDLESHVVSVERIDEYTGIKEEAPWNIEETKPTFKWPSYGKIEFHNYSVKYNEGLECVLKNLNLVVHAGEKLGIVGRTGAGKSSFVLALFRIIEATEGSILIDGVDISELGLHDLRSEITIIPQDPVLFSGTLRMNIDPFNYYSNDDIWVVLELAHLKTFVEKSLEGLQYQIAENGENLSVGQRQLVCLARALLKRTKILIMDEATAAIDFETDSLIQSSIRQQFKQCTVLTIAHRLNTIKDYDRILVLENGRIREIGSPNKLLADEHSLFHKLAKDANLM